jgi:Arc/MetJ-type ribon-helix-helix transcriptional regulator
MESWLDFFGVCLAGKFALECHTGDNMRQTLTISLPQKIKKELDQAVRSDEMSYSEIIRESLRDYLFIRKLKSLRKKMTAKAQKQGIFSDDDVFKVVS